MGIVGPRRLSQIFCTHFFRPRIQKVGVLFVCTSAWCMSACGSSQQQCNAGRETANLPNTAVSLEWKRRYQPCSSSSSVRPARPVMLLLLLLLLSLFAVPVSAVSLDRHRTRSSGHSLGTNGGDLNYPCQPGSVPTEQRCAYLASHDDVCRGDGLIPYLELHYCWFSER